MTAPIPSAQIASRPAGSRGRDFAEPESPTRSCFQRDRDRIVHAAAFRRLKYKTQVFVYHEGDHFRTRLTHSIEVAQIARSISRTLGLNEDLAEAMALAHDLGHTCFGHAGEDALNLAMEPYGGFDHNEQTFRILTLLERRYAEFDGLNLTWETLEGIVKHNGPLVGPASRDDKVPETVAAYCRDVRDLEVATFAGPEAQVAALSDDIAYNNHDIDDGLRAGLFPLEELRELPLVGPMLTAVSERYPDLEETRLIHETIRRMIDLMVTDLLQETRRRIAADKPDSAQAVRQLDRPLVAFSEEMRQNDRALRAFLFQRMYRHYKVNRMTAKAKRVVRALFEQYVERPDCLPNEWRAAAESSKGAERARLVADYIAGMTDRYALDEHAKNFDFRARNE
ncbi:deoxyguanosinetriphosphate triphosphohydrolase [Pelagibius litoralis]|uniref:Deoxyguanosinetriphosphate triphosphohydrolase-like protein n=1 Tax=Pelagibius litoralis TaxID=374515 RepID=A0A967EWN4_9PROT|nr:deoxyguanosinetriphosphate triphosphohydrolase [Pelagibius litoralis]NIA67533.1 deoxyguanosinetriphosphate triphosphohydrolase [Pelagibius litoralis]